MADSFLKVGIWSLGWTLLLTVCFVLDMGVGSLLAFEMMSHIPCWLVWVCCISCCFQLWFWAFFCSVWNHIHSSCFEGCLHSAVCLSCTVNVWYYFCKTVIPSKHKCVLLKTSKITTGTQVWLCFFVSHIAPSHTCFQKSIFWNNMTISLLSELSLLFSL